MGGSDLFQGVPQINASSLCGSRSRALFVIESLMLASVVQRSSADCYLSTNPEVLSMVCWDNTCVCVCVYVCMCVHVCGGRGSGVVKFCPIETSHGLTVPLLQGG